MADTFDPRPPQRLLDFYGRFAARFAAPGVCLCGYQLRWIAYRSEALDRGIERAMLDLAWGEEGATRQAGFVARAREVAGEGEGLTFVEIGLKRMSWCGRNRLPSSPHRVLGISMWRSDHPCGLLGRIELDARGQPIGPASRPLPLLRMAG